MKLLVIYFTWWFLNITLSKYKLMSIHYQNTLKWGQYWYGFMVDIYVIYIRQNENQNSLRLLKWFKNCIYEKWTIFTRFYFLLFSIHNIIFNFYLERNLKKSSSLVSLLCRLKVPILPFFAFTLTRQSYSITKKQ